MEKVKPSIEKKRCERYGDLTAISIYSLGRLILRVDPLKDLPSKERAAVASSGVRNSTNAWRFSLFICIEGA